MPYDNIICPDDKESDLSNERSTEKVSGNKGATKHWERPLVANFRASPQASQFSVKATIILNLLRRRTSDGSNHITQPKERVGLVPGRCPRQRRWRILPCCAIC